MIPKIVLAFMVLLIVVGFEVFDKSNATAGEAIPSPGYKVLDPIRHDNLTVFPVVAVKSYPTGEFMTLDEGLRSGDVVVTEAGNVQSLGRRRTMPAVRDENAQGNPVVLVNNFKRPLLQLAGGVVSGGQP